mmetsp:Transcript_6046/g.9172  ORF Transcript_6046/g.9172 Transcript_6046/m.9172 type:complete len:1011 (+) Transcript_6046:111-3143(+)|eukprot:CAMPEP_0167748736 /NCGR_PEP_ID=MMETSP0110_2-20121227/5002_1 /TAXON_ID=629695 /ORGANISM="Gymnochlora sp., Strain CCMP2014" /LENGTH=1010 /DNA_ID=CAMNT_0007633781 /DNA_START=1663 /DNA_END=4695 /DNA_ORIENTATION=-
MPRNSKKNKRRSRSRSKRRSKSRNKNKSSTPAPAWNEVITGDSSNPLAAGFAPPEQKFSFMYSPAASPCRTPRMLSPERDDFKPSVKSAATLSYKDILLGKRDNFVTQRREAGMENKWTSVKKKPENSAIETYNDTLLKQLQKTMRGYDRLVKHNEKLSRKAKKKERYLEKLEEQHENMSKVLSGEGTSEDQPAGLFSISDDLPFENPDDEIDDSRTPAVSTFPTLRLNRGDEDQSVEGFGTTQVKSNPFSLDSEAIKIAASEAAAKAAKEAEDAAKKAIAVQQAAAMKAQKEAERTKGEARMLKLKLEDLQKKLAEESEKKKSEALINSKRHEESKQLREEVSRLRSKLGKQSQLHLEQKETAEQAKKALLGMKEELATKSKEKSEAEKTKQKMLETSKDLEQKILALQNKIHEELKTKDKYKSEISQKSKESQNFREKIAKMQASLAEQQMARAKAETKASELSEKFEETMKTMNSELEKEREIKLKAEKDAARSRELTEALKKDVEEMEKKLQKEAELAREQNEKALAEQARAQQEAEETRKAAEEEVRRIQQQEAEAREREANIQKAFQKEKEEASKANQKAAEEIELQKAELAKAAAEMKRMQDMIAQLEAKRKADEERRRLLHNKVQDLLGHVRVYCRIRPKRKGSEAKEIEFKSRLEEGMGLLEVTQETASTTGKANRKKVHKFTFDSVFGTASKQEDVFGQVQQLITSSMDGYDVTLFAYGQTGSGKTFTMFGPPDCDLTTSNLRGIVPRAIDHIFETIEQAKERKWSYKLSASILEIYNETIFDLLGGEKKEKSVGTPKKGKAAPGRKTRMGKNIASDKKNKGGKGLDIRKNKAGKVEVVGLTRVPVESPQRLHELTRSAAERATRASTEMNARSSRSHTVFMLYIDGKHDEAEDTVQSMLTLVDLAGSERLSKTNAEGVRLAEAKSINMSLTLLGNCVRALAEKSKHVPYRNSKLTYLLYKALSGTGKTAVMVNISPEPVNSSETLCTLRFADKLKEVKK